MLITKVEIFKLNVPCREPFVVSRGVSNDATNLAVKIYSDEGLTGTGECSPLVYLVGETQASEFEHARDIATMY